MYSILTILYLLYIILSYNSKILIYIEVVLSIVISID